MDMSDKPPLPPGVLPNITDTDPPPLNPATVVGDGVVSIDEAKSPHKAEQPPHEAAPEHHEPAHDEPEAHPDHPEHHTWLERMGRHGRQERAGRH
jgi:hypothetical protein